MEIGKTFYAENRKQWRTWLSKNHKIATEIWLVYYNKKSGRDRIPYNEAVEEALCYGWIDSTMKPLDEFRSAQRFSPRKANSKLSELNKERVKRLIEAHKMTKAGLESINHHLKKNRSSDQYELKKFKIPSDILVKLKSDPEVWKHFKQFPVYYQHIRIGFIDGGRNRPEVFKKRLEYFMKMTTKNKKYGMVK